MPDEVIDIIGRYYPMMIAGSRLPDLFDLQPAFEGYSLRSDYFLDVAFSIFTANREVVIELF